MKQRYSKIILVILLSLQGTLSKGQNGLLNRITLLTQSEVDSFGALGYTHVDQNLIIGNEPNFALPSSPPNDIHDLSSLATITSIAGALKVQNTSLISLDGLNNLKTIGYNFSIIRNKNLTSLDLDSLYSVGFFLEILQNTNLTTLSGLDNLNNINGLLDIHDNENLTTLNGLENLYFLNQHPESENPNFPYAGISVYHNPSLIDYCALNNLVQNNGITGQYRIEDKGGSSLYFPVAENIFNPTLEDLQNGDCLYNPNVEYCTLSPKRNRFEWIKEVNFNGELINHTGKDVSRYGDYTIDTLFVDTAEIVSVELTPGYKRRVYKEAWRIWVDWNHDGDFDDIGEKVFQQKGKNKRTGSFIVPVNVSTNDLRMRVAMRWKKYAPSCGTYNNGEVEDYTIRVNGAQGASNTSSKLEIKKELEEEPEKLVEIADLDINPISKGQPISGVIRSDEPQVINLNVVNILGQTVKSLQLSITEDEMFFEIPSDDLITGVYFINVNSNKESIKVIIR